MSQELASTSFSVHKAILAPDIDPSPSAFILPIQFEILEPKRNSLTRMRIEIKEQAIWLDEIMPAEFQEFRPRYITGETGTDGKTRFVCLYYATTKSDIFAVVHYSELPSDTEGLSFWKIEAQKISPEKLSFLKQNNAVR